MDLAPVQLLVIGFDQPDFRGEIAEEIAKLSDAGLVRLLDAVVISKAADGTITRLQVTELDAAEMAELGATVGALIGLGLAGEDGAEVLAEELGAEAGLDGHLLDGHELIEVIDEISPDSTAAVILLEHRWAAPLRDAIVSAGGEPVIDMWVHPLDLVAIGLEAGEG